jgi:hypothetical protein
MSQNNINLSTFLMLFTIVNVAIGKLRFIGQHIFRNQSPDTGIVVTQVFKELGAVRQTSVGRRIDKHFEFHNTGTFDNDSAQHFNECNGRRQGSTSGYQIINDQNTVSLFNLILLDRETRTTAVLGIVVIGSDNIWHLSLFSHHDERLLECQGNGRAQDKSASVQTGVSIDNG